MSNRSTILRSAIAAFDKGDLLEAASILDRSQYPIDRENATNCRNLAADGQPHMLQMQGYLLRQHLQMAETFRQ